MKKLNNPNYYKALKLIKDSKKGWGTNFYYTDRIQRGRSLKPWQGNPELLGKLSRLANATVISDYGAVRFHFYEQSK